MFVRTDFVCDFQRERKNVLHVVQEDSTRKIRIELKNDGNDYDISSDVSGETIIGAVAFRKSDGTSGLYDTLPAPEYSDEATYAVGDYALHEEKTYHCTTAINIPEEWNSAHWAEGGAPAVVPVSGTTNKFDVYLCGQCFTAAGPAEVLVKFYTESGKNLHTFAIDVDVQANPAEQVQSMDYFRLGSIADLREAVKKSVMFVPQTLSSEEKEQARENIGAASNSDMIGVAIDIQNLQNSVGFLDRKAVVTSPRTFTDEEKEQARENIGAGTYSKPSGGIPASDLASGVIPSVPTPSNDTPSDLGSAAAGSSTNYSRADHVHKLPTALDVGAYVKPSSGIPKTDLAEAVQTSLGRADSAEAARTDVSAAFAAQAIYQTPETYLASLAAGRYVLDDENSATISYADNNNAYGSLVSHIWQFTDDGFLQEYFYSNGENRKHVEDSGATVFYTPVAVQFPEQNSNPATKQYVDTRPVFFLVNEGLNGSGSTLVAKSKFFPTAPPVNSYVLGIDGYLGIVASDQPGVLGISKNGKRISTSSLVFVRVDTSDMPATTEEYSLVSDTLFSATAYAGDFVVNEDGAIAVVDTVVPPNKIRLRGISSSGLAHVTNGVVRYDTLFGANSLSENEKAQARENIGAIGSSGEFDKLTVGLAKNLKTDVGTTDTTAYVSRTAPAFVGNQLELRKIVGMTLGWNQLLKLSAGEHGGIAATYDSATKIYTLSGTSATTYAIIFDDIPYREGHVYYTDYTVLTNPNNVTIRVVPSAIGFTNHDKIKKASAPSTNKIAVSGFSVNTVLDGITLRCGLFDLTEMFGVAVADAINNLEQTTSGAGVAWVKRYLPEVDNDYYAYNAGSLQSVKVSAHKTTDTNSVAHSYVLDSTKEFRGLPTLDASGNLTADGDEYTPSGTIVRKYGVLTNQSGSIGDTITLTGCDTDMTDLVSSAGRLSDIGTLSGTTLTLTVDLDGADIVYPLATPTSESGAAYTEEQVDGAGWTEEFVDAAVAAGTRDVAVPVGHESWYMADLKAAIERVMVEVPQPPEIDGTFSLCCTVSNGTPVYTWVSNS